MRDLNLESRFWAKVDKNGPIPPHRPELGQCWVWTASKQKKKGKEYGWIRFAGRMFMAHRIAWYIETGDFSPIQVLHKCDNPSCVRFSHLFEGTNDDNVADKIAKGRDFAPVGEMHGNAKLSELEVRQIRHLYMTGQLVQTELARKFNVAQTLISRIVRGEGWAHVR